MEKTRKTQKRTISVLLILCLLLSCVGCSRNESSFVVTWIDADGSIIETVSVSQEYDPSTRELPKDTDDWHYTGWQLSQSGEVIVCTATRVSKTHIIWKDYDGTVLKETFFPETEEMPTYDLPQSGDKWKYTQWNKAGTEKEIVFTAEREPNSAYFVGNVFQIVVKDKYGEPLGSGSGFVINEEGWFITNNHVMEDGYSAIAFFDIKDAEAGQQYTKLDIIGGAYNNEKKDIFIGKLAGYEKISRHYKPISFTEEYTEGEISYSVGYPNSSTKLEINAGKILEEYSDIYDKIDGMYYVLSDSYIAPGSSGGILVNEDFEVIGITSMGLYSDKNNDYYISGGSIPYFLFKNVLNNYLDRDIRPLYDIYKK